MVKVINKKMDNQDQVDQVVNPLLKGLAIVGLCIALMIILIVNVSASFDENITDGLQAYYQFEDNLNDREGNHDAIMIGTSEYTTDAGKFNKGIRLRSVDEDSVNTTIDISGWDGFAIAGWITFSNTGNNNNFWFSQSDGDNEAILCRRISTGRVNVNAWIGSAYSGDITTPTSTITEGVQYAMVVNYNGSHVNIYVDGVNKASSTSTGDINVTTSDLMLNFRIRYGTLWGDTYQDELAIWNRSLTLGEISEYYNSGAGQYIPNITIESELHFYDFYPYNNSNITSTSIPYTINFEYNLSDNNQDMITCHLYEDSNLINTTYINATLQSYRNISRTFDSEVNYTTFNYSLICNDSSTNATDTDKFINIIIDETDPDITINHPLDDGTSIIREMLYNNITYYDDNLYNATIKWFYPNGTLYQENNSGIITDTTYNFTDVFNLSGEPDGVWQIQARGCDGHTQNIISDYEVEKDILNKKITFDDKVSIQIEDKVLEDISSNKYEDRYSFEFTLKESISLIPRDLTFKLHTEEELYYVEHSNYKAHFISGNQWIDFELEDYNKEKYSVKILDKHTALIIITTTKNHLIFKSIGELNCDEKNITFIKDNNAPTCSIISIYPSDIDAFSSGKFEAIINCTDSYGLNISSIFMTSTIIDPLNPEEPKVQSLRPPANNKACSHECEVHNITEAILRGTMRGLNNWYDSLFEDNFSYNVYSPEFPQVTIINGSDWALFNLSWAVTPVSFRNTIYLNRMNMESAQKYDYEVYKDKGILIKVWDMATLRGVLNYTAKAFRNWDYTGNPNKLLDVYVCNSSFNPQDIVTPLLSPYCAYTNSLDEALLDFKSYNASNSSYTSATFGVTEGIQAGIIITSYFYLYIKSDTSYTTGRWLIRYANSSSGTNVSFKDSEVAWTSSDDGLTFVQAQFTPDYFITSIVTGDLVSFGMYASDNSGNEFFNLSLYSDEIGYVNHPINTPRIISYEDGIIDYDLNGTHNSIMDILLGVGIDPNVPGSVNHTILLVNYTNPSQIIYIIGEGIYSPDDTLKLISFNTSLVIDGYYKINVTAQADDDENDTQSYLTDSYFKIDNQELDIIDLIVYPSTQLHTPDYGNQANLTFSVSGDKLTFLSIVIERGYTSVYSQNYTNATHGSSYEISLESELNMTGSYSVTIILNDSYGSSIEKNVIFTIVDELGTQDINHYQLDDQTNVFLLFVMVILYLGVMALGFAFKNIGFASLGFFIGVIMGFMFYSLSGFMTIAIIIINVGIFFTMARQLK